MQRKVTVVTALLYDYDQAPFSIFAMIKNNISILIGSGFSVAAGLPSVIDINNKFSKLKSSEIIIHSSQDSWFLRTGVSKAQPCTFSERFAQDFIGFYNKLNQKIFHYEDFYDYVCNLLKEGDQSYESFFKEFIQESEEH